MRYPFLVCSMLLVLALIPIRGFALTVEYIDDVQKMYIAYYGRPADPGGLSFWTDKLAEADGDLAEIIDAFGTSKEYDSRFGELSSEELVNNIYKQLLGRDADPAGLEFYVDRLESGLYSLASIALNIADGIREGDDDFDLYENKLTAATAFTDLVDARSVTYAADQIDAAVNFLADIRADDLAPDLVAAVDTVIEVLENIPPSATDDSFEVVAGAAASLDVVANDADSDGTIVSLSIVSGPAIGSATVNALVIDYAIDETFSGTETLEYEIVDDDGATARATVTIVVQAAEPQNQPPIARPDTASVQAGQEVNIDVLANDEDPDGQIVIVGIETDPGHGFAAVDFDNTINYTADQDFSGTDSFIYLIRDDDGADATAQVEITVTATPNQAPVAVDDIAGTEVDTSVAIDVLGNDTDIDGAVAGVVIDTGPANGSATVNADNTVEYQPATGFEGDDSFTYFAIDDDGGMSAVPATVNVTVSAPDTSPVAADDTFTVDADSTATLDVTGNDSDDGSLAAITLVSSPAAGTATIVELDVEYVPGAGFTGDDSFTYTVSDDDGNTSNIATASISVVSAVTSTPFDTIRFSNLLEIEANTGSRFIGNRDGVGASATLIQLPSSAMSDLVAIPGSLHGYSFEFADEDGDDILIFPSTAAAQLPAEFSSSLQTVTVTSTDGETTFGNLLGERVYAASGDTFDLVFDGQIIQSVTAPTDLIGSDGQQILLQEGNGLETEVFVPADATHMIAFGFTDAPGERNTQGQAIVRGVIVKTPVSDLTPATGGFTGPLFDAGAIAEIQAQGGFKSSVFVGYTNEVDNATMFPGRPVPMAAGQFLSLRASQLDSPAAACDNAAQGVRCAAGVTEYYLVTNRSGEVRRFSPEDGASLGNFLGGNAPNFLVDDGWQALQGPDNCIVVSDEDNGLWLYDTAGDVVVTNGNGEAQGSFGAEQPIFSTIDEDVRGIAFHSPDGTTHHLYLAINDLVVRYDYSTTGTTVLSNRTPIVQGTGGSFSSLLIVDDTIVVTDSSGSGLGADRLRRYQLDGTPLDDFAVNVTTPYQLSPTFDGGIVHAEFGVDQIIVYAADGTIETTYSLDDQDLTGDDNPRGVMQLRNGDYLVSGRSEIGVSVLGRTDSTLSQVDFGSNERFITEACLQ